MVGVGTETEAVRSVGGNGLGSDTFKALGRAHGVQTILTGELTVSRFIEMGHPSNCGGLVLPANSPDRALSLPETSTAVATK